jgi:hypothetical protein
MATSMFFLALHLSSGRSPEMELKKHISSRAIFHVAVVVAVCVYIASAIAPRSAKKTEAPMIHAPPAARVTH